MLLGRLEWSIWLTRRLGISYIDSTNTADCTLKDVCDIRTFPGPGKESDSVWKTPSRIAYEYQNEGITGNQWGFQVTPKMISYSWTKLMLDKNARVSEFDDPSLRRSEGDGMLRVPYGKSAADGVTEFLKKVYDHIVIYVGNGIIPELLEVTRMEFWFTVPAIWSHHAKSATLAAAKAAGFASGEADRIYLIPEPEAAGIATLKAFSEGTSVARAQVGDGILICDCGGGTVDITSYRIRELSPKLEFEEIVEGIGGKCGSTYIDREFHSWMSKNFGQHFDMMKFEKIGPGSRFMKDFESHKRDFGYSSNLDLVYEINLVIPGARDSEVYDEDESVVKLTG